MDTIHICFNAVLSEMQTNVDHFYMYTIVQFSASTSEDQRLEQTDFAVVHDSPLIGARPSIALV